MMHTTVSFEGGMDFGVVDNGDNGVILTFSPEDVDRVGLGVKLTPKQYEEFHRYMWNVVTYQVRPSKPTDV